MSSGLQDHYLSQAIALRKRGYTIEQISEELLVSKSAIHRWIVKFAPEYSKISIHRMARKHNQTPVTVNEDSEIKALQAQIKKLERELEDAQIRAEVYDKMIDIAEATFRIPIRKKSGTKQ
jgi:orotate phosphoribosyltransferase-like protein